MRHSLLCLLVMSFSDLALAQHAPPLDPPILMPEQPSLIDPDASSRPRQAPLAAPTTEWTKHKSANGGTPSGAEQRMLWSMNRARSGPTAEGQFLSATGDPQVQAGINFFGVNLGVLQTEFLQLAMRPPAAFDIELHEASRLHSLDLIARDAQDHDGQIAKVQNSGFACNGGRFSVFSYTQSALHGHAALNIDWGPGTDGTQDPPGHRYAIMDVPPGGVTSLSNVGLALVPDANPQTQVGPLVFSGAYCQGGSGEQNRFIIGTVWNDQDDDLLYDEGEGIGGVTVMPDSGTYYAVTGTAGGFAIPVAAGNYTVSFSGGGLGGDTYQLQTTAGSGSVLMDLKAAAQVVQVPALPWIGWAILCMSIGGLGFITRIRAH